MKNLFYFFAALFFFAAGSSLFCQSIESCAVFTESGISGGVTSIKAGVSINWNTKWFEKENRFLSGHYEASVARWVFRNGGRTINVMDYSATPVFQYKFNYSESLQVFTECAIGFHLLSNSFKMLDRNLGIKFQFGDHLGVGLKFGQKRNIGFVYRFQHLSNASLSRNNMGINFHQFRIECNI